MSRRPPSEAAGPKYESFSLVSEFNRADMDRAIELMSDDVVYAEQEASIKAARAAIKAELAAIAERNGVKAGNGFRHSSLACYYNGSKTKWTLNAGLLAENGVKAEVIEDSYKESKPYVDVKVVDLSKPKKSRGEGEDES